MIDPYKTNIDPSTGNGLYYGFGIRNGDGGHNFLRKEGWEIVRYNKGYGFGNSEGSGDSDYIIIALAR